MKRNLMDDVAVSLLRRGYTVKSLSRNGFDIVARKLDRILLIKVLEDANSVNGESVSSMRSISSHIGASPIIVAEKASHPLEDWVVYLRFGVQTCNYSTFTSCLDNRFPLIISTKAGLTASVIGSKLRQLREEKSYSLGLVSRRIGVSKRMVSKYESENSEVSMRSAVLLHKLFGKKIFDEVDIFSGGSSAEDSAHSIIAKKYDDLGFSAADTSKAPFDVVAKMGKELILTEVSKEADKFDPQLESLSQIFDADPLIIFEKKPHPGKRSRKAEAGSGKTPKIQKKEFLDIETAQELIRFLKEFE